jgi:hypothetical protein
MVTNLNLLLALAPPGGGVATCFDLPQIFLNMCNAFHIASAEGWSAFCLKNILFRNLYDRVSDLHPKRHSVMCAGYIR